jgi:WD40 repeat protein
MDSLFRQAQVAIGADGSLAFLPGGDGSIGRLAWIDREGHGETLPFEPRLYGVLDLDAHDDRLAVHVGGVTDSILICDLRSGTERFLRVGHHDGWPRWSHSGDRLAVASGGENETRTVKVLDVHSGSVQAWSSGESRDFTGGWSEDEEWVAFTRNATGNPNLSVHAVNAQGEEVLCTQNGFHCSFSPDGRWIVHTSTASGFLEIHARSWPDGEEVHRVSHLKGIEPIWCPSGEIFMRDGNRWYAVPVELEPEFSADRPRVAFETAFVDTPGVSYDVSSDGQRLYYVQQAEPDIRDRIRGISRWASTFGDAGSGG